MGITVRPSELGEAVEAELVDRLQDAGLADVLRAQAQRRISNQGDTTHRYPELWDHPRSYRRGGQALRDTGALMNGLHGLTEDIDDGVKLILASNESYALPHQFGFSTSGPNFIPLTRKAARLYDSFQELLDRGDVVDWDEDGVDVQGERLVRGKDFIMAWGGVTVPQRKIFNTPPEDVAELGTAVRRAMAYGHVAGEGA